MMLHILLSLMHAGVSGSDEFSSRMHFRKKIPSGVSSGVFP